MSRRHISRLERSLLRLGTAVFLAALLWGAASAGEWITFWWLAFAIAIGISLWVLFLKPTPCDVQNVSNGMPCSNNARGLLGACWVERHQQIKHNAVRARVTPRAWWARGRRIWTGQRLPQPTAGPAPPAAGSSAPPGRLCRDSYEWASLTCTVISTVTGLVALLVQLRG
jgi:hypothetical protein